jgi:peptide/nickel transport system permease protein
MIAYIIRRLLQAMVTIFFVTLATFAIANFVPNNLVPGGETQVKLTEEDVARIRAKYELDLYWPIRYTRWLVGKPDGAITIAGVEVLGDVPVGCYIPNAKSGGCKRYVYARDIPKYHPAVKSSKGILRGDFGTSTVIRVGQPALGELYTRLWPTLELGFYSLLFSLLIGIPLGIYSAVRQYSRFDYIMTAISFFGSAMPAFFFALLMILIFTITPVFLRDTLPWVPRMPAGLREAVRDYEVATWLPKIDAGSTVDHILHLIMPVFVLTFVSVAGWSRFIRSSMLEVLRQDYIRTARAKGLIERIVIMKHALRNALIPFVTILVLQIPGIIAGAPVTEGIFAWPGMGRLFLQSLGASDWPIALAYIFITAMLTVLATLIGDILYTLVDPRIKLS